MRCFLRGLLAAIAAIGALGTAGDALAAKRALLIGISDYQHVTKLDNPGVDVRHVALKLSGAGFQVTLVSNSDTTREGLIAAFERFAGVVEKNDEIVVYYAGHGVELSGDNMLVPSDSPAPDKIGGEFGMRSRLVAMRELMAAIEDHAPAIQIWIVDACRENPYSGNGRPFLAKGGLGKLGEMPTNSFVLFSANYKQTAQDRLDSDPTDAKLGSPFERVLTSLFDEWKDRYVADYAREIRRKVLTMVSPNPQFPIFEDGIVDQWCFVECRDGVQSVSMSTLTSTTGPTVVDVPGTQGVNGRVATVVPTASEQVPVVFLGKLSAVNCSQTNVSDLYPFGCEVLRRSVALFSGSGSAREQFVGGNLKAQTAVFLRKGLPTTDSLDTQFGCKVRVVAQGETIKIESAVALKYSGDTFYWGMVDSAPVDCSPEPRLAVSAPSRAAYRRPDNSLPRP